MKKLVLLVLCLTCLSSSTFAIGALYARRALSEDDSKPLWLKKYDASVTINDQMAVTHVDQTFKNESSNRLEGIFVFPLPNNAIVTELALWINGVRTVGSVLEKDTARAIYESVVRKAIDPALLEYMGNNLFKLSVFPIEPNGNDMSERRIEITYAELLPYQSGNVEYKFFMKSANMSSKAVERTSLVIDFKSQKKILSCTSPSHDNSSGLSLIKVDNNHYTGVVGNENTLSEKDFKLDYELENTNYALNHLTYTPRTDSLKMFFDTTGDNPYYLLWVTPPDSAKAIKKNVTFLADISSSMSGTRIIQLRQSLKAMVSMLSPADMFNIIAFSTGTQLFKPNIVVADSSNKALANQFINQLTDMGLTNMEEAFKAAFATTWDDTSVNAIVFLTDGNPTLPTETTTARVLDSVTAKNKKSVAIFPFGIGDGVDESFLKRLAKNNDGNATMIAVDDSISGMMSSFMHKISFPLIKKITMDYGALEPYDVIPNPMPNLYAGTQLTVLGRYKKAGTFQTAFKGVRGKDSLVLNQDLVFPSASGNQPFVARMWASAKIDWLLNEIGIYGELPELVTPVKILGKKYAIITPYTSMLVIEHPTGIPIEDKTILAKTAMLLNSPNPIKSLTTIRYTLPMMAAPQKITLKIFDARGCLVRSLVNDVSMGGNFAVQWDAKNTKGSMVPSGIYIAILESSGGTRLMLSMKVVR